MKMPSRLSSQKEQPQISTACASNLLNSTKREAALSKPRKTLIALGRSSNDLLKSTSELLRISQKSGVNGRRWSCDMSKWIVNHSYQWVSTKFVRSNYDEAIRVMQRAAVIPKNPKVDYHDHVREFDLDAFIIDSTGSSCSRSLYKLDCSSL